MQPPFGNLENYLDAQATDEGHVSGDIAEAWPDELDIRGDSQPGEHLKVVKEFRTGAIAWSEHRLKGRAVFICGAGVKPTKPEGIVFPTANGAVTPDSQADKPPDGSGITVADGCPPE